VGGMLGVLMTGLLATTAINPGGKDGLAYGNPRQLLVQFIAMIVCAVFSFVASWGLLRLIDKTMGLRVRPDHENIGLDLTQHRESAYTIVG
jgi:Amt family ammonium transporter